MFYNGWRHRDHCFLIQFCGQGNLKGFYGYYKGIAAGEGKFNSGRSTRDAPYKGRGPQGGPGGGPGVDPGTGGCGSAMLAGH